MVYIDAHTHFGGDMPAGVPLEEADKTVEMMDSIDMDGMITCSPYAGIGARRGEGHPRSFEKTNKEVAKAMEKWPDRFYGLARINPHFREDAVNRAEKALKNGFLGIKFHPRNEAYLINSKKLVFPILEKVEELGGLVLFHTGGQVHSHPTLVGNVAKNFPDVPIILGHLGGGFEDDGILIAKWFDNVIADTSFCQGPRSIEKSVALTGAENIAYASDYPQGSIELDTLKVQLAEITEREKQLILGENIKKILDNIKAER